MYQTRAEFKPWTFGSVVECCTSVLFPLTLCLIHMLEYFQQKHMVTFSFYCQYYWVIILTGLLIHLLMLIIVNRVMILILSPKTLQ